jgi:PIN domain nuclease of toxin-antitoxin system
VRLLLDTNVFLWSQSEPSRLGEHLATLEDPRADLFLSSASAWEIAIKYANGKLTLPEAPRRYVPARMRLIGAQGVAVEHAHALAVLDLPSIHRDPFDRLLVAQASLLDLTLVTSDERLTEYDVATMLVG